GCVLFALDDLLERLLRCSDRHVGGLLPLCHLDVAVLDVDLPLARTVDVEQVRVVHARRLRRVDARLETVEKLLRVHGTNPTSAGSSLSRRRAGGSMNASALASNGAPAATNSAVRRLDMSATRPSATAAMPPRPTERPITRPDAVPTCR